MIEDVIEDRTPGLRLRSNNQNIDEVNESKEEMENVVARNLQPSMPMFPTNVNLDSEIDSKQNLNTNDDLVEK